MTEKRMYTGETAAQFYARRAPMENLWNGFMRATVNSAQNRYEIRLDEMLAKASVLSVPDEKVRELVAAEHKRAESSLKPFNWDTISDQILGATK